MPPAYFGVACPELHQVFSGLNIYSSDCTGLSCALGVFSWGMGDLVPWPGTEPGTPAFAGRRSSHWATRKIPPSDFTDTHTHTHTLPWCSVVKNLPASAGGAEDVGSIPGLGRSPGEGNGSPFQYSCLENPMDRRAWRAAVHGVAELDTAEHVRACTHTCNTHTYARCSRRCPQCCTSCFHFYSFQKTFSFSLLSIPKYLGISQTSLCYLICNLILVSENIFCIIWIFKN